VKPLRDWSSEAIVRAAIAISILAIFLSLVTVAEVVWPIQAGTIIDKIFCLDEPQCQQTQPQSQQLKPPQLPPTMPTR
jgi:uncharacterized membrane protein